jgi:hypothetical protein
VVVVPVAVVSVVVVSGAVVSVVVVSGAVVVVSGAVVVVSGAVVVVSGAVVVVSGAVVVVSGAVVVAGAVVVLSVGVVAEPLPELPGVVLGVVVPAGTIGAPTTGVAPIIGSRVIKLDMPFIIFSMGRAAARGLVLPVAATPAMPAMALTTSRRVPDICCWMLSVAPPVGRYVVATFKKFFMPPTKALFSVAGTMLSSPWIVLMAPTA